MIKLEDDEFLSLCEMIHEEYGINLKKKRILIEYRLMSELNHYHVDSFQAYFQLMRQDSSGSMKQEMLNRLTTNYTFFLREQEHFQYIKETLLPTWDHHLPLHIWIAGCSSGQECYTLAMELEELRRNGRLLPNITITATDISTKMLERAKNATYPLEAMEVLPEEWKQRYCIRLPKQAMFQISPRITKQVNFQYHNLMEPFKPQQFQLIMCRNVMIYFDESARAKILQHLYTSLKNRGYLILGHAEVIPYTNPLFQYHGSSIYQMKARTVYG